jgi:selenium metabolism protein YedF
MPIKVDCRKLQCPAPVIQTKKILEQGAVTELDVIVDNDAAVENVTRLLSYHGFDVSVDSDGVTSTVSGRRSVENAEKTDVSTVPLRDGQSSDHQKILLMISSQEIGKGDSELGQKLMVNFVKTLKEMGKDLWRVVFLNHGVKFSTKDSAVLEDIKEIERSGVSILVCGACLTHLGLLEEKSVGETTNMLDIVTSMQIADKVISL